MQRVLLFAVNRSQERYFRKVAAAAGHITVLHDSRLPLFFFPRRLSNQQSELLRKIVDLRLYTDDQESPGYRQGYWKRIFNGVKYYLSTYIFVQRALTYFSTQSYSLIGLWSGRKWRQLIVSELFSGNSKFIYFENGAMPETSTVDPSGVNFTSSIPRDPSFYLGLTLEKAVLPSRLTERKAKKAVKLSASDELPDEFIFIPFQVDSDTQIVEYSPWIHNMSQFYEVIVNLKNTIGDKIPPIVVKEHPSSKNDYRALHQLTPDVVFRNSANTQELIEKSSFVITVNSSVGFEAILLNKPVVTLGNAFYNIEGLVTSAQDAQSLELACQNVSKPQEPLRSKFLDYLQCEYYVPGDWRHADEKHVDAVVNRITKALGA